MVARCLVLSVLLFASNAFADTITFTALMNGPNESPPTPSLGTGVATVIINTVAHTMSITVSFAGLTSNTVAAHIHCCTTTAFTGTAGVATMVPAFTNFPLGVTSGFMPLTVFDLTNAASYNPAFVTAQGGVANAEAALIAGMMTGKTYFNIHTVNFGGGEIRGFLVAPEPSTVSLSIVGLFGMLAGLRIYSRRRGIVKS